MTIFCDICKHQITSLKTDLEAQREVMEAMATHLMSTHKNEAAEIAQDCVCVGYMFIRKYMNIPATEKSLIATLDQAARSLLEVISQFSAA
jgi:hypothetical protein